MIAGIIATDNLNAIETCLLSPPPTVNALEWRLDYLDDLKQDLPSLHRAFQHCPVPVILTLRTQQQGGYFKNDAQAYQHALSLILKYRPAFCDIEYPFNQQHADWLCQQSPNTHWIISHHYHQADGDISDIFRSPMPSKTQCWFKLINHADNAIDALRWQLAIRAYRKTQTCIAHSTGECASFSRVLGRSEGNPITYAALPHLGPPPASGLMSAETLSTRYHYDKITPHTQWFGLIGNPVEHSQGDRFHNDYFFQHHIQAGYLKMPLTQATLPEFFTLITAFNIGGLSVTTPLKQAVLTCLNFKGNDFPAINTLTYHADTQCWSAANTDVLAAESWLNKQQPITSVLIIGAGDTAQAMVHHLCTHHPQLTMFIVNRTNSKLQALKIQYPSIKALSFEQSCPPISGIINTIPNGETIDQALIQWLNREHSPALLNCDYQLGATPPLIQFWEKCGLSSHSGLFFFQAQALAQQERWQDIQKKPVS